MNKKTPLIKNYVLGIDVIYLDYNLDEGLNYRYNNSKTSFNITKNKTAYDDKKNGTRVSDGKLYPI